MASWMIHLRVADSLMDTIAGIDQTAFVMGNIAPDSGVPNADWSAYIPPKDVSHYKTKPGDMTFYDIDRFLAEHFSVPVESVDIHPFMNTVGYYEGEHDEPDVKFKVVKNK